MTKPSLNPETLSAMSLDDLRAIWRQTQSAPLPAHASRDLLARALVYRAEVKRSATSVRALHTRLAQLAASFTREGDFTPPAASGLRPGAVLIRDWNGKRYAVTVTSDGFLLDDARYDSLSAVAQAITGAKWSGPRFFKLNSISEMKGP
ncbi:MAG: DUF2924 domain-containing protein [Hyphomonadaceae bacterium]|nr:DUF2924 domain-containing protein [Hyphomonadaceae bacterium]